VNHILNYKGFPAASGIVGQLTADTIDPSAGDFRAAVRFGGRRAS